MYYLDTNTCIYFLNGKYESIKKKILSTPPNEIAIPSIVKAELLLGAYKSKKRNANLEKVEKFLIQKSLTETGGNQVQAAKLLGISRNTLRHRIEKYRLSS